MMFGEKVRKNLAEFLYHGTQIRVLEFEFGHKIIDLCNKVVLSLNLR